MSLNQTIGAGPAVDSPAAVFGQAGAFRREGVDVRDVLDDLVGRDNVEESIEKPGPVALVYLGKDVGIVPVGPQEPAANSRRFPVKVRRMPGSPAFSPNTRRKNPALTISKPSVGAITLPARLARATTWRAE